VLCFACLRAVSIIPNVARVSGLSILDCLHVRAVSIVPNVARVSGLSILDCLRAVSIVPNVARVSGLSILDCLRAVSIVPNVARVSGLSPLRFSPTFIHRRLCRVKHMLAMYLKYHKAALTPTTSVTSIAISPVKMSIVRKSLTNLRSEMIFLQGKPVFYIFLPSTPPY
jgi:hypothetical protein